ncbi:MAG TPA: hypothetical protein VF062_00730 [Candidatus Limnocylindrales bacterium]
MPDPLSEADLQAIVERDSATEDGLAGPDYRCADDRHVLLVELSRMRTVARRLQSGVPQSMREGDPWLFE